MTEKKITKNSKPIPCKIILVGDSGVGKTSIINRYLDNYKENITSTLTASYSSKLTIVKDYKINFQLWDTAGQEQYRSMNSLFYKDAHICIMAYDITKENTFNNIKNYWYESVSNNGLEGVIFGVAGNKNDLYMEESVDKNEVNNFCKEINAVFKLTSAKQNFCIDDLFNELGERFLNSNFMLEIGEEYFERSNSYNSFKIKKNNHTNDKNKKKRCC